MNRRQFLRASALASTGLALGASPLTRDARPGRPAPDAVRRPHIILLMTDQHRGDALGCAGHPAALTPHLDGIAARGVRFVNGFSSTPSCTPARAGLLTGLSPWHHGMLGYGRVARRYPFEMPQMLAALGYFGFGIGKMHWFPQRNLHGFDGTLLDESGRAEQEGFISDYRTWFKLEAPGANPDATGIGWNEHRASVYALEERLHPTAWTGSTAVRFIENYKADKPLFLKVSFARPHSPYDPPRRYLDRVRDARVPPRLIGDWAAEFAAYPNTPDAPYGDFGEAHAAGSRRHYYASIAFIDDQIGAILAALKKKGFLDNTLVLFTSDHGDMLGDHYHWRKTCPYQGSANIPFLMQWPAAWTAGIARGTALRQPVELRDILPTFLDAAGGAVPEAMDGRSLLGLVRDPTSAWRSVIDLEHAQIYRPGNYWGGLTDGRIKYVWFYPDGREQLFDLDKDPGETRDVARDRAYADALTAWRDRFAAHLAERGEGFVKDGKPAVRRESLLYSPLFPKEEPPPK